MTSTSSLWIGSALTLVAGIVSGNFMLPTKFVRRWPWEAIWLVFSLVSLLILPCALAVFEVHRLLATYSALQAADYAAPLFFGFGWGIAQILFGLSISRLGMALGYPIIVGLGALLGTLVPLFFKNRAVIGSSSGNLILAGVTLMVIGIAISAWAGLEREKHSPNDAIVSPHRGKAYWVALSVALLCGLMAPMLNYAFAFGDSIAQNAVRHGTSPEAAPYAIWPVALFGGLIPNLGYALALLTKNRSWMFFRESIFPDLWLASSMGILWMGALAIYSVSSVLLGTLGTSVGWALFQIFMILTANCAGVLSGEWRTALPAARRHLWTGLGLLVIASAVIAAGNR